MCPCLHQSVGASQIRSPLVGGACQIRLYFMVMVVFSFSITFMEVQLIHKTLPLVCLLHKNGI